MSAKKKGNPAEGFALELPKPPARTAVPEAEAARFTGDAPTPAQAPPARPMPAESTPSRPSDAAVPPSRVDRESASQALAIERTGARPAAPNSPAVALEPSRPAVAAAPENQEPSPTRGDERPASERAAPAATGDRLTKRKVRVRKTDGVPMRRTTVWLKADMAKRLAVFCALNEVSQTDIIDAALADYFERHDTLAA